jgi:hypothetical protein
MHMVHSKDGAAATDGDSLAVIGVMFYEDNENKVAEAAVLDVFVKPFNAVLQAGSLVFSSCKKTNACRQFDKSICLTGSVHTAAVRHTVVLSLRRLAHDTTMQ